MSAVSDMAGQAGSCFQKWSIPSSVDAGARLFVQARGTRSSGEQPPVVLVHGFFQPASAILDVPGFSLQASLAEAGLRTYLFDFRGYGLSTRPAFMDGPAEASKPSLGCMEDALADLHDVVGFVKSREGVSQVDLLGYSWGTARSASFALAHPEEVRRLALYAPVWRPNTGAAAQAHDPGDPDRPNPELGGYALFRPGDLQRNWDWEIGTADASLFRSVEALAAADSALMASDPSLPGDAFRAPLGPMVDALAVSKGGSLFDAEQLTHETLLIRGAQDRLSSAADAEALFGALGSAEKQLVTMGLGTHLLHLEHARGRLASELTDFFLKAFRESVQIHPDSTSTSLRQG